jgi:hypothetical protein
MLDCFDSQGNDPAHGELKKSSVTKKIGDTIRAEWLA